LRSSRVIITNVYCHLFMVHSVDACVCFSCIANAWFSWVLYEVSSILHWNRFYLLISDTFPQHIAETPRRQIGVIGWLNWTELSGWLFCQRDFSISTKDTNFKLCTQITCAGGHVPIYFFNFRYFFLQIWKIRFKKAYSFDLQMASISNFAC